MKKSHRPSDLRLRNLLFALNRVLLSVRIDELPSRVREVPDERTARFYSSIGLLSPPTRFDGRRAFYGRRHLLELLAIKRLQSRGLTIRQIRDKLKHASLSDLTAISTVPPGILQQAVRQAQQDPSLDFWPRPAASDRHPASTQVPPQQSAPADRPPLHIYKLAPGVYLSLDLSVTPGPISDHLDKMSASFDSLLKQWR